MRFLASTNPQTDDDALPLTKRLAPIPLRPSMRVRKPKPSADQVFASLETAMRLAQSEFAVHPRIGFWMVRLASAHARGDASRLRQLMAGFEFEMPGMLSRLCLRVDPALKRVRVPKLIATPLLPRSEIALAAVLQSHGHIYRPAPFIIEVTTP